MFKLGIRKNLFADITPRCGCDISVPGDLSGYSCEQPGLVSQLSILEREVELEISQGHSKPQGTACTEYIHKLHSAQARRELSLLLFTYKQTGIQGSPFWKLFSYAELCD